MLSLLLAFSLHADPTFRSSTLGLDGTVSIMNPREDGRYGYTYDSESVLCQRYGHEYAREIQLSTAWWGLYESVHLDEQGEVSAPASAETIAKRLICYSVSFLKFN